MPEYYDNIQDLMNLIENGLGDELESLFARKNNLQLKLDLKIRENEKLLKVQKRFLDFFDHNVELMSLGEETKEKWRNYILIGDLKFIEQGIDVANLPPQEKCGNAIKKHIKAQEFMERVKKSNVKLYSPSLTEEE